MMRPSWWPMRNAGVRRLPGWRVFGAALKTLPGCLMHGVGILKSPGWLVRCLLAMLPVFLLVPAGLAQERILAFDSVIQIAADGSMTVRETIRVRAEGRSIRRGIYRDFPTRYQDRFGNRVVVGFEVLAVERNGRVEPWFDEAQSNGVRVYVGQEGVNLQPGEHIYTIRYRTSRQLGFFADHDELYWNVTGNGWQFTIDAVSARVMLPAAVAAGDIGMAGYTGAFGETGGDARSTVFDSGASVRTTRALAPGEGLTLVMTWPKGIIQQPTMLQRLGFLLHDNLGLLLALFSSLIIVTYLLLMWRQYGRDPAAGVVFPHYEPPAGYSPASARYLTRMGYDNRTLAAAIINLAVKGYLTISSAGKDYVLEKADSQAELAPGEKQVLFELFKDGSRLELDNSNHRLVSSARSAHARALRRDYVGTYFKNNTALVLPAIVILGLMLVAVGVVARFTPAVIVVTVLTGLLIPLFVWLLKAPTTHGRRLLDRLEGFRLYLEVAEKDDLNLRHPPELTPALFERYLPFAIALGVEQPWAERFARVFAGLDGGARGQTYRPAWYHGDFSLHNPAGFSRQLASGFAGAISSAASPPGSSSGSGGGGFSGGGGGGGGGGGW